MQCVCAASLAILPDLAFVGAVLWAWAAFERLLAAIFEVRMIRRPEVMQC